MISQKDRVVYTVIIGDYDRLQALPSFHSDIRCVCFTDNKELKAQGWEMVLLPSVDADNRALVNRSYKFLPYLHFEADQSLYIDGNIRLMSDPSVLFEQYLSDVDIAIPRHSLRNCAYAEILECVAQGLIDGKSASAICAMLKEDGFPCNHGLYENNIILRNHNAPKLRNAMEMWYCMYKDHARRDQLSLTYCLWKYQVDVNAVAEGPRYSHRYFKMFPHNHHLNLPLLKRMRHEIRVNSKFNYAYELMEYLISSVEKNAFR